MAETTKQVTVRFKPGEPIMEDGKPKVDEDGKVVRGSPIAARTVEIKNLTAAEAMDADDFAVAASPTGNPSRDNRIRAMAICAIRKVDEEVILRPRTIDDFRKMRDRFTPDELLYLGEAHITFVTELNDLFDPKVSSSVEASSP